MALHTTDLSPAAVQAITDEVANLAAQPERHERLLAGAPRRS